MLDEHLSSSESTPAGRPRLLWLERAGWWLVGGALLLAALLRAVHQGLDGWLVAALTLGLGLATVGVLRWPAGRLWLQQTWGAASLTLEAQTFILVGGQLGLLALVIQRLQLESAAFYQKMIPLAYIGFLVHHLAPRPYRRPLFVALSWVGCCLIFGVVSGMVFIALALLLIGVCHAPLAYRYRVGLLLLLGTGLASLRLGLISPPLAATLWPIWPALAVLGMFRLGLYLVEQRRRRSAETSASSVEPLTPKPADSLWQTLAYFFQLPGLVFPLFPVLDYATFKRADYDRPAGEIYQTGLQGMVRGVGQLIVYRFLDHYLYLSPEAVTTPAQLTQFILVNYGLYVRISGQFHLIIGLLHLFGFNLPRANQHYFLAHNINDFWRRINIYWKEFMVRYFFYPATMRLRGWRMEMRLVIALLYVLAATWFLHTYQWFWIRGEVRFTLQDGVFWGVFGLLMIANGLYDARAAGRRRLSPASPTARMRHALGVGATFTVIALIWSFWTAPSPAVWQRLWHGAHVPQLLLLLGIGLGLGLWPAGAGLTSPAAGFDVSSAERARRFGSPAWWTALAILGLFLLTSPIVRPQLSARWPTPLEVLHTPPAAQALEDPARGYYEALLAPLPAYAPPLETQETQP